MSEQTIPVDAQDELDGGPLIEPGTNQPSPTGVLSYGDGSLADDMDKAVAQYGGTLSASQRQTVVEMSRGRQEDLGGIARALAGGLPITPELRKFLVEVVVRIIATGERRAGVDKATGKPLYVSASDKTYNSAMSAMVQMVRINAGLLQVHKHELIGASVGQQSGGIDLTKLSDAQLETLASIYKSQGLIDE